MLGIYARVSQEDAYHHSIEMQIALGKEYAEKISMSYQLYVDNGISGTWEIEKRPQLFELVNDITRGKITNVFAYDQSRLERNNNVWSNLYLLFQSEKVNLNFYDSGNFDFSKDENFLTSNILSVFNAFYVKLTKRKVKAALLENIKRGKVHSLTAYGYKKGENGLLVIDEEKSDTVKLIYKLSLSGIGTNKIAETLNENSVPTTYNSLGGKYKSVNKDTGFVTVREKKDTKWAGKTVQGIIKNTIYKGKRYWQNNYYDVPAIFSEEYWQEVNDNLIKNRNNTGKKIIHKYLLKGKLTCARCGRNYYGRSRENKHDHVYMCSSKRIKGQSCGNGGINIDKIENVVWSYFFERKELLKLINSGHIGKEERMLENENNILKNKKNTQTLNNERDRIVTFIAKGILNDDEAQKEILRIRNGIQELERDRNTLIEYSALIKNSEELLIKSAEQFNKFSNQLIFTEKKEVINTYIKRIKLNLVDIKKRIFAVQIDFNFGIDSEKYFLINELIMSISEQKFKQIKGLVQENAYSFDDLTFDTNIGILAKPWVSYNKMVLPITNTIYPYGICQDWNLDTLDSFYTTNPEWLSSLTGTNIHCINENEFNYAWLIENYKLYKNNSLREWLKYLLSFDLKIEGNIVIKAIPL